MIHHVHLSRPIVWRLDDVWAPIELPAFGLRLLGLWTEMEQWEGHSTGSEVFRTNAGWTLVASRSLVLQGDRPQGGTLELFAQLAQRLRWASGQASIPRTFLSWGEHTADGYSILSLPEPEAVGNRWLNRSFYAAPLTPELGAEAGQATDVETPFLLLADAAEATSDGDLVRAILYSAFAAETCSRMRVQQLGEKVLRDSELHYRVAPVGGEPHDDVLAALIERGRRNADTLLHELPVYLERRSLQRDLPRLWQQWKRLKSSRNKLAHEGDMDLEGEAHLPVTGAGAAEALRTAIEIFEWWGMPARRFLESTPAVATPGVPPGFFNP